MASPFPLIADGLGGTGPKGDIVEPSEAAAASTYGKMSSSFLGTLPEVMSQEHLGSIFLKEAEQAPYKEGGWWRDFLNASINATMEDPSFTTEHPEVEVQHIESPILQPDGPNGYNERYAPRDPSGKVIPIGDQPMPEKLAEVLGKQKAQDIQQQSDIARYEANHSWLTARALDVTGMITDPTNIALGFIPGIGEEAIISRLGGGLGPRLVARGVMGAEFGATQQAIASGVRLAAADDLQSGYNVRNALRDVLLGAASGSVLNLGFGGAFDTVRYLRGRLPEQLEAAARVRLEAPPVVAADAETNHAAAQSAVAQIVTGRPVDVDAFYPKAPARTTETAMGRVLNAPWFENVTSADLGLDRREVARTIAPNMVRDFERQEATTAALSTQLQEMNAARARGDTAANQLIADQITQLQQQLTGKLSKAQRATTEQRLADLQGQIEKVPSEADFNRVQQQFQEADAALRDMSTKLAPIFQRADQTIALATAAETGRRAEDLFQRQRDFMMRNFTGLVDREKAWKETGIAPGIAHDDLVRATGEVETTAAAAAKQPPVQTLTKPPENWIQPATTVPAQDAYAQMAEIARNEGSIASSRIQQELGVGYNQAATLRDQLIKDGVIDANGKATGKVPTPATPAPEARAPQTFEQVYPELANRNLTEEDKAELMEAHRQVEQAELKEGAYQEAAMCLKGG